MDHNPCEPWLWRPQLSLTQFLHEISQGFTTATGKSNRDDPKNSLVATAMSYVDFYRPRYLLLENVKGFTEIGDKSAVHKKAFVKFVMRCLTELG